MFFGKVFLSKVQFEEDAVIVDDEEEGASEGKNSMEKMIDDYLISIIPPIAMTGIRDIDCPDTGSDGLFGGGLGGAFGGIGGALGGLGGALGGALGK